MKNNIMELQNGSDIRGIAIYEDENIAKKLGIDETKKIARAFINFMTEKTEKEVKEIKVAIGHDSRLTGESLASTLMLTISSMGASVENYGLASTPAMFMATKFSKINADAAIMVTASHLPKDRNGFKFFTKEGGLEKADIKRILEIAASLESDDEKQDGFSKGVSSQKADLMSLYCEFLRDKIKKGVNAGNYENPLFGLKIVVDAGNGSGGFYAKEVLEPLGADISASQFIEPNGNFPNHIPNPEDEEAMKSISERVKESGANFGIIFDTDVDRVGAVDKDGKPISRNSMVALAAALLKNSGVQKTTVVTDSITSNELTDFIEKTLGYKHQRFKRGYKNVINESIRLNKEGVDSKLAIETSGHAAFEENFFLDDGAYLATKIVIAAAKLKKDGEKGIESLIADLKDPLESIEVRLPITCEDFATYADKIIEDLQCWLGNRSCMKRDEKGKLLSMKECTDCLCKCGITLQEPNFEGVRINFDEEHGDGWALIRKSLHESLMPINMESKQEGGTKKIAAKLKEFLWVYKELDVSKL